VASPSFVPVVASGRRISIAEIDAAVSARLGPTRGLGNSQPACFNRQVAMYLGSRVGRWSTTAIGRFYNGRDHSTVCYGIQRIESLRENDPDVDALVSDLIRQLSGEDESPVAPANQEDFTGPKGLREEDFQRLAEFIASRVCAHLQKRPKNRPLLTGRLRRMIRVKYRETLVGASKPLNPMTFTR
jgi:Bacterial dnaA protein helix-turn-helix